MNLKNVLTIGEAGRKRIAAVCDTSNTPIHTMTRTRIVHAAAAADATTRGAVRSAAKWKNNDTCPGVIDGFATAALAVHGVANSLAKGAKQ